MRLEVHTKHGVFYSNDSEYNEDTYDEMLYFVKGFHELSCLSFKTNTGDTIYMTKGMIDDSVFIVRKNNEQQT